MKLIFKRVGPDPRRSGSQDIDSRPMALHTEDGECLPCQIRAVMSNEAGSPPNLTVTFAIDGTDVVVEGDQ